MTEDVAELGDRIESFRERHRRALRTFGMGLTRKCQVACKHCINDSLPNRKQELTPEQIEETCRELSTTGEFDTVNLTGGEPFEVYELLLKAVEIIAAHGLRPTVVSSASWATTADTTREQLDPLGARGLQALIISRDEFHEPRVPHQNVAHSLRRALELGIISALNLTTGSGTKGRDELLAPVDALLSNEEVSRIRIMEATLVRSGRAARLTLPPTETKPHPFVCNVNGPVLLEDGEFVACCGATLPAKSPLRRGHSETTTAGEMVGQLRKDPLVSMIRSLGLQRMVQLLPQEDLEPDFASFVRAAQPTELCTICIRLLANPQRVSKLRALSQDPDIKREMAVNAALFYCDDSLLKE
jgi:Radical SAM superfamily/4Fe-4S single cluster domain